MWLEEETLHEVTGNSRARCRHAKGGKSATRELLSSFHLNVLMGSHRKLILKSVSYRTRPIEASQGGKYTSGTIKGCAVSGSFHHVLTAGSYAYQTSSGIGRRPWLQLLCLHVCYRVHY